MSALASVLPPETLLLDVPEDTTLPEVLAGGSAAARAILDRIYKALPENIRPAFFTEPGLLSDAGKEAVGKLLLGSVVDYELASKQRASVLSMLTKAIPQMAAMHAELVPGLNLRGALEGALAYGLEHLANWTSPLGQGFLGGVDPFASLAPEQQALVRLISDNARSDTFLRKLLGQYVTYARGSTMMGQAAVSPVEALGAAARLMQGRPAGGTMAGEPSHEYQQDLFGRPVPVETGLQPVPALPGREDAAVPSGLAGEADFSTRTELVSEQARKVPAGQVTTPAEAAEFFAYLGDRAEEHFEALLTDKDGKPLAIVGAFKGTANMAMVPPVQLLSEAFRVEGAANLWLAHNHPSGDPRLSEPDQALEVRYENLLRGSGIAARGMFAIGGRRGAGRAWHFMAPSAKQYAAAEFTEGTSEGRVATRRVSVMERRFTQQEALGKPVIGSGEAVALARDVAKGRSGLFLLNAKLAPVAFVPLTGTEARRLRQAGRLDAMFRALSETAASAGIIVDSVDSRNALGLDGINNLVGFLQSLSMAPLDVVQINAGGTATTYKRSGRSLPVERTEFEQAAREPAPNELFQTAYHGSPRRDIERMSTDFIGTGEGAASFGWGLYFAGAKAVGRYYRDAAARNAHPSLAALDLYFKPGRIIEAYGGHDRVVSFDANAQDNELGKLSALFGWAVTVQRVEFDRKTGQYIDAHEPQRRHATLPNIKNLESVLREDGRPDLMPGSLYTVELAPQEDQYLLWDRPISAQSGKVKAALAAAAQRGESRGDLWNGTILDDIEKG
jgi:hypothetical protein